jgi:hypothetical protein
MQVQLDYYYHLFYYLLVGYIYNQNFVQVYLGLKIMNHENHHQDHWQFFSLAGSASIPASRGVHIGWIIFLLHHILLV